MTITSKPSSAEPAGGDEIARIAEAMILQFIAAQPVHIGVAMARRFGKPRYQRASKPAPKLPGPKPETQASTKWRNDLLYRTWRTRYPELGPAAFAKMMVAVNARYLSSALGYKADVKLGEPPLDQLEAASYLIRFKGLAVPGPGLRNILEAMHKDSMCGLSC